MEYFSLRGSKVHKWIVCIVDCSCLTARLKFLGTNFISVLIGLI
jgi:hypothetical protein